MICIDTTVLIDLLADRATPQVIHLESLVIRREDLCICGVILTEILQGIKLDREYRQVETVLSAFLYLPMHRETFLLAASIYRSLRFQGITIRNSVDCMIAAVCIEQGVPLLQNDRDFEFIAAHSALQLALY